MAAAPQPSVATVPESHRTDLLLGEKLQLYPDQEEPSSALSASDRGDDGGNDDPPTPISKPKWYRRLNPLRLQKVPPVPTERRVSREYGASFLSIITFQWVAPLMHVSVPTSQFTESEQGVTAGPSAGMSIPTKSLTMPRLVIYELWNCKIYGKSIPIVQ
jgi:hypothetical protein